MSREHPTGTIVKINILKQPTDYKNVFGMTAPTNSSGSGWVVDIKQLLQCGIPFIGKGPEIISRESNDILDVKLRSLGIPQSQNGEFLVIVTNMHVVNGFKSGSFQIDGTAITYTANLLVTFPDRDLALILPDLRSLDTLKPHRVSTEYIRRGDSLIAYGYANGRQLCVSKGDLKRIMSMSYSYSSQNLLAYEMTSPINPGDSGGPVFNSAGDVVAVTHQHAIGGAQAQSHSIPITELVCAVQGYIAHGRDVGVLSIPIKCKPLLNPEMRAYYEAPDDGLGALVDTVSRLYQSPFLHGDILVRMNGLPIDAEGHVPYGETGERVAFTAYIEFCQFGDNVTFSAIRNGRLINLIVNLTTPLHALTIVPTLPPNGAPHAFYRHGFAFIELNAGLQKAYTSEGKNTTPLSLFNALQDGVNLKKIALKGRCYVLLMSQSSEGYSTRSTALCVTAINEKSIRDIWHVQQILDSMNEKEKFVRVYCDNSETPTYVLPRLNMDQERRNRTNFSIPDRFESLPKSEVSIKKWNLIREKYKQGLFNNGRVPIHTMRKSTRTTFYDEVEITRAATTAAAP